MNPERWARIKEVYHSALDLEPGRREEFLKEACAGDEPLFKEVKSLLAQEGISEVLFDSPAIDAIARAVAEEKAHKPRLNVIGETLSHYLIEKKIGEGGMGEVFLAQDSSLNRKVALKFLPPEMQQDPVAHKRFLREARSAAALDNPYICSIHEVGESEGKDFIVMEYVDGQTLSEKLRRGRLSVDQALQIATEVAEAVQMAHGKGIIHRDLKPSNIMLTKTGHAKVMDFGLAKQIVPSGGIESQEESVTAMTRSGMTMGTLAYMSPEQVRGEAIDPRSDIFSFGLVLYEMLTGTHPFRKESSMETASAILHEEPRPVGAITKGIPADLEKLISRCLRKDLDWRLQHIADVKIFLAEMKGDPGSGRPQVTLAKAGKLTRRWFMTGIAAIVVLTALAVVGLYWVSRERSAEPEAPLIPVPLTSYPGRETSPSFSPDGSQVAFSWNGNKQDNFDIYVKQIGVDPPSRLTSDMAEDFSPAWSPDGRFIAFLRRLSPTVSAIVLIPQRGGPERVVGECDTTRLAWTPDSKCLVLPCESDKEAAGLFLLNIETGDKQRLTTHPFPGDTDPEFSPDGRTLAFTRGGRTRSDIHLLHLGANYKPNGTPERIVSTEEQFSNGAAWMPDGREIIFVSGSYISRGLWRMAATTSAKPRRLAGGLDDVREPAVSSRGNRLAYVVARDDTNIWRGDLSKPGLNQKAPVQLISSTRHDEIPAYSLDGKKIAFTSDRSGAPEIWVCNSDGSNPVQLTSFGRPLLQGARWSPDGQSIAFYMDVGGNEDIYTIRASGGAAKRLTTDPAVDRWPCWSQDGQSIYFKSSRGAAPQIWKVPAGGGEAVQVTQDAFADMPHESCDGKFVFYSKGWPAPSNIWSMPVGGGEPTKILDGVHPDVLWTVGRDGIYFFAKPDEKNHSDLSVYEFATGKIRKLLTVERPVKRQVEISPDGQAVLYTQVDEVGSDLMLVENFR